MFLLLTLNGQIPVNESLKVWSASQHCSLSVNPLDYVILQIKLSTMIDRIYRCKFRTSRNLKDFHKELYRRSLTVIAFNSK